MAEKLTKEIFVGRSEKIHGKKYGYLLVNYKNIKTKVEIYCNICSKSFWQRPECHLIAQGCPDCGNVESANKRRRTNIDFINDAHKVHKVGRYGYGLLDYINSDTEVNIICNNCGVTFKQTPHGHLGGKGCENCSYIERGLNCRTPQSQFISDAIAIHGYKFGYSLVKYNGQRVEIDIICNSCLTTFKQIPKSHLIGGGCPNCKSSRGESRIRQFLIKNNIDYIYNKSFGDCKNPKTDRRLRFDFFIPSSNLLIEFDGRQHFVEVSEEGFKRESLADIQYRDNIKNEYASKNNIKLLRIPYWDIRRVPEILKEHIIS
jgi:protein-arginine kinase activator protein McsA